ncbi:hypothetical protein ACP275_12G130100 [Erythranthe tilingii]
MFPFTTSQWQELEHQALVFKYMISGLQIPQDLLFTITTSLHSSLSSKLLHHPPPPQHMIGWNGYQYEQQMGYGHRKIDPEPGRCRRTDGKKWRCSKEAYPDSKYCERHMHRGRNRSRKPVENITLSSKPPTNINNNNNTAIPTTNNYSSSSSAQSHFLYPHNTPSSSSRPSATKFFMESNPYRSRNGRETDEHPFFSSGINSSSNGVSESASWQLSQMKQNNAYNSSGLESWQQQLQSLTRQQNHHDHFNNNNNNNNYSSCNNHVRRPLSNDDRDEEDNHQPKKVMHHFLDSWPDSEHHQLSNNNKTHLSTSSVPNSLHDFFMTEKW